MSDILSNPQFDVIDLGEKNNALTIEVRHGGSFTSTLHMDVAVEPPITEDEYNALMEGDSPFVNVVFDEGMLRMNTFYRRQGVCHTPAIPTGESSETHMGAAIVLAQGLIALRGLSAARVTDRILDREYLVINKEETRSTVGATIDVDDFMADSRDLEWQTRLKAARGYVDELESREQSEEITAREGQHREPEVEAARDAIARVARENPSVRWSSREIREAARFGVNPGALGIALDMLEAEGVLVRDGEDSKYSLSVEG